MPDIMPFGAASPAEAAEQPPNFLDKLFAGIINGTVSIPKHVIQAAAQAGPPGLRREDVTDIPGSAQPVDPLVKEATDAALNIAGTSVPFATSGAAGVFGGRLAQNADLNALQRAEKMATAGADRKAIWDETGWFKGSDDKWRFEIPDYKSQMRQGWHDNGLPNAEAAPIASQLWHKDLYQAYPDLRRITGMTEKTAGESGVYTPAAARASGEETINIRGPNAPAARSVALHEMQHAIQEREGFAHGGSPSMFSQADDAKLARDALSYRRELEGLDPSLTPKQKDEIVAKRYRDMGAEDWMVPPAAREVAHDVEGNPPETLRRVMELYGLDKSTSGFTPRQLYHELPGEIEARNVQARRDMTPAELRAKPPWETAGLDARPIMSELFGTGRVGSLEGGAVSNGPHLSVDPLVAQATGAAMNMAGASSPFAVRGAVGALGGRLGTADRFGASLEAKYPNVKLDISPPSAGGYATLGRIVVPEAERGAGVGSRVMSDLIAEADAKGVPLALSPTSDFGGSKARLMDFYQRFGFVPNKGANKDFATRETMIRAPRKGGE